MKRMKKTAKHGTAGKSVEMGPEDMPKKGKRKKKSKRGKKSGRE